MPDHTIHVTNSRPIKLFRSVRLLLHIISGLIQSGIYPYLDQRAQWRMAQRWSAGLLSILRISISYRGAVPPETQRAMLAANHVSWLDVYSINTVCPARFVAKSEIRSWPLLGWLSKNAGTLFIERSQRRDTARINEHIGNALSIGDRVAVFPEGTTGNGTELRHFHASLLQPAVSVGATLCPVAIRYTDLGGEISRAAPYVGITLLESLRRILEQPWLHVELTFCDPIECIGKNRRELARGAEQAIARALSLPLPHKAPGRLFDPPGE